MRTLLALIVGIVVGAYGMYLYQRQASPAGGAAASPDFSSSARGAADRAMARTRAVAADVSEALGEKMKEWNLTPDDIHADLEKGGAVVRENAARAREKVADARIVTVIKAKFVLDRDLDADAITVESRDGNVTLTGTVANEAALGKATALALDTDGVHNVAAKLKVAGK